MATVQTADLPESIAPIVTLADALAQLGDIPTERILYHPSPGQATEEDVLEVERRTGLAPELVDGVLVEKAVGFAESVLAQELSSRLREFTKPRKLGWLAGADCPVRLFPGTVRLPDVCFISRDQIPGGKLPDDPIASVAPALAIEVLSAGNTRAEMQRKLHDYFSAGVRLVWYIDPRDKTCRVFTSPDDCQTLGESDTLDGGEVLPGFELKLAELFAALRLDQDEIMLQYKAGYKFVDGGVHAQVLDFPAAITCADDLDGARRLLAIALVDVAEAAVEMGRPLPVPNSQASDREMDIEEPIYLGVKT